MIRLAFYGKGGIGKSTTAANLAVCWAERGLTVLQVGCDPKADSTFYIRGGKEIPTVMEKVRSREPFTLDDVVFVKNTDNGGRIICAEAGGPHPGRGCAGRGIMKALEVLREKGILTEYEPDIVLYDILGDVVCGGFAMPMREGYADSVFVVTSGENMSIYAAANIGLAVEEYRERGYAELGGLILNERNVKREKQKVRELAQDLGTEIRGTIMRSELVQEAEERRQTVAEAFPESGIAGQYRKLADSIAERYSVRYPVKRENGEGSKTQSSCESQGIREQDSRIPVGSASFPAPFKAGLEFNPPVHETWNIVHIGMLMPESHQIYICSDNCMRGVVMTAAEMNALDRFSCVVLEEADMHAGNLEEITLEGVSDVLRKIRRTKGEEGMPRAVIVFPVCLHHFVGCDFRYVYGELEKRFPDITFLRGWMDPIMQKTGPTPDQKLRKAMMDILERPSVKTGGTALLGDIYPLDPESELMKLIKASDRKKGTVSLPLQIQDCPALSDYGSLASRDILITRSYLASGSVRQTARRLGAEGLYLPAAMGYEEIGGLIRKAAKALGVTCEEAGIDPDAEEARCDRAFAELLSLVGDTPIAIDAVSVQRPLGLARYLTERGFSVKEIYLDAVSAEEEPDFKWLRDHAPQVLLCSTIHTNGRLLHAKRLGSDHQSFLAIGPKAAWFCGTGHFVNIIDNAGMWGYDGIRKLAALMEDAYRKEKDTRDLVPRKGLGCGSFLF